MTAAVNETMQTLDLSVPLDKLPLWVYGLSAALIVVPLLPFGLLYGAEYLLKNAANMLLLPIFIALVLLHEVCHAIGWKFAGGLRWSNFKFGFSWKGLAPYCHATVPMNVQGYRFGAALPGIVTGVVPLIIGTITADAGLTFVSAVMISAAVGDIYVLWTLRNIPPYAQVIDHPSNAGCLVLLPQNAPAQ